MADTTNLLPCPFCGSTNIDPEGWASTDRSGPACDDCCGSADTVDRWNSRHFASSPSFDEGIRAAMKKIDDLRTSEAGEFNNPACRGQRGEDRSNALYDAYQILRCMLPDQK